MTKLNRRKWLQLAGMAAPASMINPQSLLDSFSATKALSSERAYLCYNENPYAPSQKVKQAMIDGFHLACRYPGNQNRALEAQIAEKHGLKPANIVVTNGSREGLNAVGLLYGSGGQEIITCEPTYEALLFYAEQFGANVIRLPLLSNLEFDLPGIEERIRENTSMVFICNPNNPTGTLVPDDVLEAFARRAAEKTMVFIDEVYYDYIEEENYKSMTHLVEEGLDVIISRTFSKIYGLAGLRVGYLIAPEQTATKLRESLMARGNMMAILSAQASLDDDAFYELSLKKNKEAKTFVYELLDSLGLEYKRSHTNFVFFKTGMDIKRFIKGMGLNKVKVGRPFPPLNEWCRVSTGTMEDMHKFGEALLKVIP